MTLAANVGPPNGLGDHCRATRRSYPPLDIGRHICLSAPNKIMAATIMDQAATSGHHANLFFFFFFLTCNKATSTPKKNVHEFSYFFRSALCFIF
jgi:hypothetical protein